MKLDPSIFPAESLQIFKILGVKNVRYVGGCVRNALMGLTVTDIDMATTLHPQEVMRKLTDAKIKTIPTGFDHGTVTAIVHSKPFEITTLRKDVETDGRRAVVAYTTDWAEDAARRDFTINALYADMNGIVYDPLGQGLADIERRKVRFVGDSGKRIQEDILRILRFFRFHALYGRGPLDKTGLAASITYAPLIKKLSRERVTTEIKKLLMAAAPQKILSVMQEKRIIPEIIDKNFDGDALAQLIKFQSAVMGQEDDIIFSTRLFLLTGKSNYSHLVLSKKQTDILRHLATVKINFDNEDLRKILYLFPRPYVIASWMVYAAQNKIRLTTFKKMAHNIAENEIPVFPVTGKDLLAIGMAEGAMLGKTLKKLEKKWIDSGFALNKKSLIK